MQTSPRTPSVTSPRSAQKHCLALLTAKKRIHECRAALHGHGQHLHLLARQTHVCESRHRTPSRVNALCPHNNMQRTQRVQPSHSPNSNRSLAARMPPDSSASNFCSLDARLLSLVTAHFPPANRSTHCTRPGAATTAGQSAIRQTEQSTHPQAVRRKAKTPTQFVHDSAVRQIHTEPRQVLELRIRIRPRLRPRLPLLHERGAAEVSLKGSNEHTLATPQRDRRGCCCAKRTRRGKTRRIAQFPLQLELG